MTTTLTQFIADSHIDSSLIRAVVRNMGGWQSFKDDASAVCRHGADCGFGNFVYYADTVKFAKKHKNVILSLCKQYAEDMGNDSIYSFIGGFNCLKLCAGDVAEALFKRDADYQTDVFNALAWFAQEEVCRSFEDQNYCD